MGPGAPVRERALIRSAGGACAMTRCSPGCSAARPSGLWQAGSSRFGCGLRNRRPQVRILSGAFRFPLSEDQQTPTYEEALRRVHLEPGQPVLDIGCGVGAFLRLIADRGARAFGLDASEALLEVARTRLPDTSLRLGDMEALPYEDHTFDLVTGFNSFFFADDIVAALREAGRVAKPGAPVVIQVWGAHERCDLEAMKV